MVDMENQSSCRGGPGPFDFFCKCEDARNNTYACLRTLNKGDDEDTVRCFFEEYNQELKCEGASNITQFWGDLIQLMIHELLLCKCPFL